MKRRVNMVQISTPFRYMAAFIVFLSFFPHLSLLLFNSHSQICILLGMFLFEWEVKYTHKQTSD